MSYSTYTTINYTFYQYFLTVRFAFSYNALVSTRLGSSSARYWSIAASTRPAGNSLRRMLAWGRVASANQSVMRMAISDEIAWTLAWSLKGGTFSFPGEHDLSHEKEKEKTNPTCDSYISLKRSQISAKRTPH